MKRFYILPTFTLPLAGGSDAVAAGEGLLNKARSNFQQTGFPSPRLGSTLPRESEVTRRQPCPPNAVRGHPFQQFAVPTREFE